MINKICPKCGSTKIFIDKEYYEKHKKEFEYLKERLYMKKEIHCCKCNNVDFFKVEADLTRLFIFPNRYLTVKLKPKSHNPLYTIPLTQYTCLKCGYVWFRVDNKNDLNTISKLYDELG